MHRVPSAWLLPVALAGLSCGVAETSDPPASPLLRSQTTYGVPVASGGRYPSAATGFNAFIVQAAKTFGSASYLWEGDGVTREIRYQDVLIAKPYAAARCHCVGATFQVYMTAFQAWDQAHLGQGSLRGLTPEQVKQLKQIWFVATSALEGSQAALTKLNLGTAVTSWSQALPGDPVQIWRQNGSGHSVIFDSWVKQGTEITGITYFSCQNSGPGFVSESIGTGSSQVDPKRIHIVHPRPPSDPVDAGPSAADRASTPEAAPSPDGPTLDGSAGGADAEELVPQRPAAAGGCAMAGPAATATPLLLAPIGLLLLLAFRRRSR